MTENRLGGIALLVTVAAGLLTMGLHPTGRDLSAPGQVESASRLAVFVHAMAIASLPLSFLGALVLTRRLTLDPWAITALAAYGLSVPAVLIAAAASGLIATSVTGRVIAANPQQIEIWRVLLTYTGIVNQAFARITAVAWGGAITFWSVSIVRKRRLAQGVGVYGLILGPAIILAVASGHLRMDVHGFGLVVVGQAVWFGIVGVLLVRMGGAEFR